MIQLLTATEITDIFNAAYHAAIDQEPRLFLLSIIGNANYGFAQSYKEIFFSGYYLPTFEDLCKRDKDVKQEKTLYFTYNDYQFNIVLSSIKELPYDLMNGYSFQLETFYSSYQKVNERYKGLYNKCFNNQFFQDSIKNSLYIKKHFISDIYGRMPQGNPETTAEYFELMKLFTITKMVSQGSTYKDAFHPTDDYVKYFLTDCLSTDPNVLDIPVIVQNTKDQVKNFYRQIPDSKPNVNISYLAEKGVVALLRDSFQSTVEGVDILEFLTSTEKMAYNEICARLKDNECIISISKIITETGISRTVYKSVTEKMEKYHVATVTNMGVKGTKIVMNNS